MKPSKLKINVLKIDKAHLYQGKTAKYLDCAIWPNKNGADEYGNTHYITQEISRESREAGQKGAIIGNIKWEEPMESPRKPQAAPPSRPRPPADPDLDVDGDQVPF